MQISFKPQLFIYKRIKKHAHLCKLWNLCRLRPLQDDVGRMATIEMNFSS